MADKNPIVFINGFGPADLIKKLQKATWGPSVPGMPNLKSFLGISLAGARLNSSADIFSYGRFLVTVENLATGKRFEVSGFTGSDIILGLRANPYIVIERQTLRMNYVKYYCRYRVTVEKIK